MASSLRLDGHQINIDLINVDLVKSSEQNLDVSRYVGSAEAAHRLGVSTATLYAYVSRGRIDRRRSADGRTSLFDVDELERLTARARRPPGRRATIDVRISSSITTISERGVLVRGHDLCELARTRSFETVAELLWTGALPEQDPVWPASTSDDRRRLDPLAGAGLDPVASLGVAVRLLGDDDDAPTTGRRLLVNAPEILGSTRRTGSIAMRLLSAWHPRPNADAVNAVDTLLALLADHELATSTLAVRVAASVRASASASIAAGLNTVEGPLHGAAALDSVRFLRDCEENGIAATVDRRRRRREVFPGFGHKVYRDRDPRFDAAMDSVRGLGDDGFVDDVVRHVTRVLPKPPNIDLALAGLIRTLKLPPDAPLFAVARIAGWAAHHAEEIDEAPVRFRGVTG